MFFVQRASDKALVRRFIRNRDGSVQRDDGGKMKRGLPFGWENESVAKGVAEFLSAYEGTSYVVVEAT